MIPKPISIVPFSAEMADELVQMWRQSFEAGVGVVEPHSLHEQRDFLRTQVVPNYAVRVAKLQDQIVGFVAADPESISQLYVHIDHQRLGIGRSLLEWAKDQSAGSLWLYTLARNEGAQHFYERHGFKVIERGFEPQWQLEDIKYQWIDIPEGIE